MGHNWPRNTNSLLHIYQRNWVPVGRLCTLRRFCYVSMDTPYGIDVLLPRRAAAVSARAPQYPCHRLPQTHYWVERCPRIYAHLGPLRALCAAVLTRVLGKLIAALNAFWLVLSSLLDYTGVYDRCYCKGDQLELGGHLVGAVQD